MRTVSPSAAILGVLLFLPAASLAQQSPDLPDDLSRFYQTRNLAAAISTPGERAAIASKTTDQPLTERLARVKVLLESIAAQEFPVDSDMIRHMEDASPFIPSAILEVVGVRARGQDVLEVETIVRHLNQGSVLQLIRSYESGKKIAAPHLFAFSPVTSREIHTWHRIGDRWLRRPAGMALLAE